MGFYSTRSPETGAYVAGKRTEEGTPVYEAASGVLNAQKQAAIQNLQKNYATTIENAYASYLANQRGIETSAMGQGYKQAYLEAQDKALQQNIAQAGLENLQARQEIGSQYDEAQSQLQQSYQTEVGYLDRVANTMSGYLDYVRTLRGMNNNVMDENVKALTEDEEQAIMNGTLTYEDLYDKLYAMQPKNLYSFDSEVPTQGMSYYEWINTQIKDNEKDTAWRDWLFYSGGYQDFINAVKTQGKTEARKTFDKKIADKEAEEAAKQEVLNKAAKAYETVNNRKLLNRKSIYKVISETSKELQNK